MEMSGHQRKTHPFPIYGVKHLPPEKGGQVSSPRRPTVRANREAASPVITMSLMPGHSAHGTQGLLAQPKATIATLRVRRKSAAFRHEARLQTAWPAGKDSRCRSAISCNRAGSGRTIRPPKASLNSSQARREHEIDQHGCRRHEHAPRDNRL